MERPFAWIATGAAIGAALCVLLPWHTIQMTLPVVAASGADPTFSDTHSGTGCGVHGTVLLVLAVVGALCAGVVALGLADLGQHLPAEVWQNKGRFVDLGRVVPELSLRCGARPSAWAINLWAKRPHASTDVPTRICWHQHVGIAAYRKQSPDNFHEVRHYLLVKEE